MNGSDNRYQSNPILSDDDTVHPRSLQNHTHVDHPNQTFRIIYDAPTTQSIHTSLSHDDGNLLFIHCALILVISNRKYLYLTSFLIIQYVYLKQNPIKMSTLMRTTITLVFLRLMIVLRRTMEYKANLHPPSIIKIYVMRSLMSTAT